MSISYDDLPYAARPIATAHPDHLATLGLLEGLDVAPPPRARILELGCAEGTHLAAIAYHYEEARLVGVDAGEVHIRVATEARDRLGLDNLELVRADLAEVEGRLEGPFDYVLCHGVLSWVSEAVAEAIFALGGRLLAPNGIAYVSYNCEPGWAIRGQLRRVLVARTRRYEDPLDKLLHARALLGFLAQTPLASTHFGAFLAAEAEDLRGHRNEYLVHEYLSPENRPYRYGEIAALAERNGLRFFAEASPVSHRGVEDQVREVIGNITDDPVEREELSDVLFGRAFRASLFVRADAPAPDLERTRARLLDEGFFVSDLTPVSKRPSLEPGDSEELTDPDGVRLAANHPLLKAALFELARSRPRPVGYAELEGRALALLKLRRVFDEERTIDDEERAALREDLLRLVHLRHLRCRFAPLEVVSQPSARPRVSTLTRFQARCFDWVSTADHEALGVDPAGQYLVALLDGSLDREQLAEQLVATLRENEVALHDGEGHPLDEAASREAMRRYVDEKLAVLAEAGLLEA